VPEVDLEAALERMTADRTAPLEEQLRWLREAGFRDVRCAFQDERFAVYGGVRPAAG
jgi:tRNA (cmo5U34)-methyltransferase